MLSSAFSSVSRSYAARVCCCRRRRPCRSNCHFWRRIVDNIERVVVVVVVVVARGGGKRADGIILEDEVVKRLAREKEEVRAVENDVGLARIYKSVSWGRFVGQKRSCLLLLNNTRRARTRKCVIFHHKR